MIEFKTQTQGLETFMVCDIAKENHIDTMGLGMLKNNRIKGLVQTTHIRIDDKDTLHYNISSQVSLRQFFLGSAGRQRFLTVLKNLLTTISELQEYMLDPGYLLQEKENIYINVGTMQTEMMYYPVIEEKTQFDSKSFVKKLIIEMEFNEDEDGTYITRLINFLNKPTDITVEEIKEYVDTLLKEDKEQPVAIPQQPIIPQQPNQVQMQPMQQEYPVNMPVVQPVQNMTESQQQQEIAVPFDIPGMETIPNKEQPVKPDKDEKKKKSMFSFLFKSETAKNKKKTKKEKNKKSDSNENKNIVVPGMSIPGINETQQEVLPEPPRPAGVSLQNVQQFKPQQPVKQPVRQPQVQQHAAVMPQQTSANQFAANQFAASQFAVNQTAYAQPLQPYQPATVQPVTQFPQQPAAGYGEATVLKFNGSGETSVLKPGYNTIQKQRMPYLVRRKTNERIDITKDVFRIGKERNYVDYWVYDNSAVSRSHADIIHKDKEFYIIDNNSLNHTFVGGTQIESQKLVKLEDFSTITMADEVFEFHL